MRKILSILLITTLILASSIASFAATAIPNDIEGTKYETAVSALMTAGVLKGYPDGTYKPLKLMNRAEASKMIVTALNPTLNASDVSNFTDTSSYIWALPYIAYSAKVGIVNGYEDNTFRPGNSITLPEMVTMVVRALGYEDIQLTDHSLMGYMNKAKELGILTGIDTTVRFTDRGTAAILLYNAFYLNGSLTTEADKLGVVITKAIVSTGDFNNLTIITSDGTNQTYNVPKTMQSFSSLNSGDIVAYSLNTDGKVSSLIKKAVTYAYSKNFAELATYNGVSLASDLAVFTFGARDDYTTTKAAFTSDTSDYGVNSPRFMQNVRTSAYYVKEDNKIIAMIVPSDVGLTGLAYGMILETGTAANAEGVSVDYIKFLLGANTLNILTNGTETISVVNDAFDGEVYELSLNNGTATNIATSYNLLDGVGPLNSYLLGSLETYNFVAMRGPLNDAFVELTSGYDKITEVKTTAIVTNDVSNPIIGISSDAVVFLVTYDENNIANGYEPASISKLRTGLYVRAYDVTDNDHSEANILVLGKYPPQDR
jgi:hypothetical protein